MHAIITLNEDHTTLFEIVRINEATGFGEVIERHPADFVFTPKTITKATEVLRSHGYRPIGLWDTNSMFTKVSLEPIPTMPSSEADTRRAFAYTGTDSSGGYMEVEVTGEESLRYRQHFAPGGTAEEMTEKATSMLLDKGFRPTGPWEVTGINVQRTMVVKSTPQAAASEAAEMLAISQTLALRALKAADKARAEASVGNRDPKKNHTYMRLAAALDAHCEQLAHLLWTRKHYAVGHGAVSDYPSAADALKYLRELAEKEN